MKFICCSKRTCTAITNLLLLSIRPLGLAFAQEPVWHLSNAETLDDYKVDPKPLIVVDVDDTVALIGEGIAGFLRFSLLTLKTITGIDFFLNSFVTPIPRSAEILTSLSNDWQIVYVSRRPQQLAQFNLDWLEFYDFPRAPLFSSRDFLLVLTDQATIDYKASAIGYLQEQGFSIEYGIGDKSTDIQAYVNRNLRGILILSGYGDSDLAATLESLQPRALDITANSTLNGLEFIAFSHETAWEDIQQFISSSN